MPKIDQDIFFILVVSVHIRMLDQAKAEVGEGLEYSVSQTTLEQVVNISLNSHMDILPFYLLLRDTLQS